MTKKYNPKQTVENILSTSTALFAEKGYDNTSMQDIVNALGMSKGAIFHHFKSKEDVFNAVMEQAFVRIKGMMHQWLAEMDGLPVKEKLQGLLMRNLTSEAIMSANSVGAAVIASSPRVLLATMQGNSNKSAPLLAELIREGIADGSFTTEFPDECAEVFLLLFNIWCDTFTFACDIPTMRKRLLFLQEMMKRMGVDIVTDEIIEESIKVTENIHMEVSKWNTQDR